MIAVLIFVCSITVAPADCNRATAIDVIAGPEAANEIQCGLHSQAFYAETALGIGPGEYLKVTCTRTSIGRGNVG